METNSNDENKNYRTGNDLPKTIVANDDLLKNMYISDERISTRTGVRERHLVKEETTAGMATEVTGTRNCAINDIMT